MLSTSLVFVIYMYICEWAEDLTDVEYRRIDCVGIDPPKLWNRDIDMGQKDILIIYEYERGTKHALRLVTIVKTFVGFNISKNFRLHAWDK